VGGSAEKTEDSANPGWSEKGPPTDTASLNRRDILAPGGRKEGVERRGDVRIGVQPVAWGSDCVALHLDSENPCRCRRRWDGHDPGIGVGAEEAAGRTSKLVQRVFGNVHHSFLTLKMFAIHNKAGARLMDGGASTPAKVFP
jgi:hypothetical protein